MTCIYKFPDRGRFPTGAVKHAIKYCDLLLLIDASKLQFFATADAFLYLGIVHVILDRDFVYNARLNEKIILISDQISLYQYTLTISIYLYININVETNIKPLTSLQSTECIENTNKQRNVIVHRLIVT